MADNKDNETSCFNCKYHPMCIVSHGLMEKMAWDSNNKLYGVRFQNVFKSIAMACDIYTYEKEL